MTDTNKKKTTIWLPPELFGRMDSLLDNADCRSRSEFIEQALRFYMGYLGSEYLEDFLSETLVATLKGIVADHNNRMRSLIFKWAVEQGIMAHTIAAHFRDPMEDQRALRAYVVDEVKRTNGQLKFEDAQKIQRQNLSDEWLD